VQQGSSDRLGRVRNLKVSSRALLKRLPEPMKVPLRPLHGKYNEELAFWREAFKSGGDRLTDDVTIAEYERNMLAMAEEPTPDFLTGKIVADFGCGPRGSLVWARNALLRIGIDVLADRYADEFPNTIRSHGMVYVKSTEKIIPLPSDFVDVLFTLNAMDHVNDFPAMCSEIIRIIRPGGLFVGSFNLNEPWSITEPQRLNEADIDAHLLNRLEIRSRRTSRQGRGYEPFLTGDTEYEQGERGYAWVTAIKPNSSRSSGRSGRDDAGGH
jgi:SAM-dependent methyltransferase